jgi:hypothetical protein|tara:strand:+ start:1585 stop:2040 length:456 start_codon:yes stop_codon:yes gene_type:complete
VDLIKSIFVFLILISVSFQASAQKLQGKVYVLGSVDQELKSLFEQTISQELHSYAQNISLNSHSHIYVFPYRDDQIWRVVSFHVEGDHHHKQLSQLELQGLPLRSLDQVREIIGLDGSLKYIGWNSYSELPPEQIFLASKAIAQNYLFLHF